MLGLKLIHVDKRGPRLLKFNRRENKILNISYVINFVCLIHCGLMMPYGDKDLS